MRYCCTVVGYSGTPLAKKLGIGEGATLALVAVPAKWVIDFSRTSR
jgi:hypothetical protein